MLKFQFNRTNICYFKYYISMFVCGNSLIITCVIKCAEIYVENMTEVWYSIFVMYESEEKIRQEGDFNECKL